MKQLKEEAQILAYLKNFASMCTYLSIVTSWLVGGISPVLNVVSPINSWSRLMSNSYLRTCLYLCVFSRQVRELRAVSQARHSSGARALNKRISFEHNTNTNIN